MNKISKAWRSAGFFDFILSILLILSMIEWR